MEPHRHARSSVVSPEAFEALRADVDAMKRTIEVLLRNHAVAISRQAKIDAEGLLSLKEAAAAASVVEGTIRNWLKHGLKGTPMGVRTYVSRQALAEYVAERQTS